MSAFGELRSLLHGAPNPQRWDRLLALLSRWSNAEELRQSVIPYASSRLESWPDRLRVAPGIHPSALEALFRSLTVERGARGDAIGAALERMPRLRDCALHGVFEGEIPASAWSGLVEMERLSMRALQLPLERVLNAQAWDRLHTISIYAHLMPTDWSLLGSLRALRSLDVSMCEIGEEEVVAFAKLPQPLESLSLRMNNLRDDGIRALMQRGPGLRVLRLGLNPMGAGAIACLANTPQLATLHTLGLRNTYGPGGFDSYVAVMDMGLDETLTHEPIYGGECWDAGVFGRSVHLAGLRRFEMQGHKLGAVEAEALVEGTRWRLEHLDLSVNDLKDEGVRALRDGLDWGELRYLDLSHNNLTLAAIAQVSERGDALRHLRWCGNGLDDDGALALSESPLLGRLERLDLQGNDITSSGVEALVQAVPENMREIDLSNNELDSSAARALTLGLGGKNLARLVLSEGSFEQAARLEIQKGLPGCEVQFLSYSMRS